MSNELRLRKLRHSIGSIVAFFLSCQVGSEQALASAAAGTKNRVLTAMSTNLKSGHPLLVIGANRALQFSEGQRYSKWSVLFEEPVRIDQVHVEACETGQTFEDGVELFAGLDDLRLFEESGKSTIIFKLPQSRSRNLVRALTLGFLESQSVCLKSISFWTDGKPTELIVPEVLSVKGTLQMGDGRIDFGQSLSDGLGRLSESSRGLIEISWDRRLILDGIRIWNGNQSAGDQFLESPRGRLLKVVNIDEKGKEAVEPQSWSLEDRRGFQKLEWPQAITSRGLKLEVSESFPALSRVHSKASQAREKRTISELHLLAGGSVWVPGLAEEITENQGRVGGERTRVETRKFFGIDEILDRELRTEISSGKNEKVQELWKFRFRSDGTVSAKVFTDRARTPKAWTFLGTWETVELSDLPPPSDARPTQRGAKDAMEHVKRSQPRSAISKQKESIEPLSGIGLRVVGVRYATSEFADSLICGNQCFSSNTDRGPASARELPVHELLEIQRGESKNIFYLRNRSLAGSRTIDFSDLKLRKHSAID